MDFNKEAVKKFLETIISLKIVDVYVSKSSDCIASSIILVGLLKQVNINFTLTFIEDNDQLRTSKNPSILVADNFKDLPAFILLYKNTIKINPDFEAIVSDDIPTSL